MVKFLADVGVAPRVVDWLRANGYDARHLAEDDLHRLPDGEIFQKAKREQRVLLTFDLDFAEIVALSGSAEVSVVLFRLEDTRVDSVLSRLAAILRESGHLLPSGVILIVEDARHRIRRLPVP